MRGVLVARQGQRDFGIVHVHAGDRGLALIVDRYGINDENVMRVGTQAVDFDGVAVLKDPADAQSDYSMFMPVSSSLAVEYSTDKAYLTVCLKK